MNNTTSVNAHILDITMTIQQEFPELSDFLTEMPVTIPNIHRPKIDNSILQAYCDALDELLAKYIGHSPVHFKA